MVALLQDPARARQMGEAGRRRVEQFFSLERRTSAVASICATVADGEDRREESPLAPKEEQYAVSR